MFEPSRFDYSFSTDHSKAVPLLNFSVQESVVSYVAFFLSFIVHLFFCVSG